MWLITFTNQVWNALLDITLTFIPPFTSSILLDILVSRIAENCLRKLYHYLYNFGYKVCVNQIDWLGDLHKKITFALFFCETLLFIIAKFHLVLKRLSSRKLQENLADYPSSLSLPIIFCLWTSFPFARIY